MHLSRPLSTFLITVMLLSLGACAQDVSQNIDGSLKLETVLNESAVLDMVDIALADTTIHVEDLQFHDGYVQVQGECEVGTEDVQPIEIRLEFDVDAGGLATRITEASVHDEPVDPHIITTWNEAMDARRTENGAKDSGRELLYVTVTPEQVCLTWRVERHATPDK